MSEVSTPIENDVAAVADTTIDAVASIASVSAEPQAPAKRAYKKRVARPVEPVIEAVRKVNKKADETVARRKYTRKPAAAPVEAPATQTQGTKTMTYEAPNWFAGFTALPGADKFQGMFADVGEKSQEAVRKSQAFAEQLTEAARANVEAVVESSRIAVAGVRDLGQEVIASSRGGVEHASTAVKTLAEAKSPTEFFQLQSELVRSSFDRMVAEGSKLTEQMVKLAGEAVQPLSNRASVNAEKFSELTA
jgi:phasin family protein